MEMMDSVSDFLVFIRKYFFLFPVIYTTQKNVSNVKEYIFFLTLWHDLIKFVENVYYSPSWSLKYNHCFYC